MIQYPLALGGVVTRVLEAGSGDRTVVCVHGSGSRADRWRPQLPLLERSGHHVYAFDLPGHGLADKPVDLDYGAPAFADLLEELLERHVATPAVLLGTSLGGQVAALVAGRRPDLVRGLVLVGAVGIVARGDDRPATSPVTDPGPAGIRRKLELLVHDRSLITDEWVAEELRVNSSPGAVAALAAVAEYSAVRQDHDLAAEALVAAGVPTLLVWGAEDRWVPPRLGEAAQRALGGVDLRLVAEAGHAPYFERPEAFFSAVEPFLAALDPAKAA